MKILYCSTLCSHKAIAYLSKHSCEDLEGIAVQKFHRLIAKGMVENGATVSTLSAPPFLGTINGSRRIKLSDDEEEGIHYHYTKLWNFSVLRHLSIAFGALRYARKWWRKRCKEKEKSFIVCDTLNISLCCGVLLSKLFSSVRVVGIMTDMPGLMVGGEKKRSLIGSITKRANLFILKQFDAYVFLTEAMNTVINKKARPYIIMEGLVDSNMQTKQRNPDKNVRNIIYAGGLYERYGIKMLIDAFRQVEGDNLRLSIYGRGAMVEDMPKYEKTDKRLKYLGLRPNDEVVEQEFKATLLVNPRPTHEEFTKYSFPSKNMEYMVSGTPLLTTALPGMPKEYYPYVFLCKEESVQGFVASLKEILSLNDEELAKRGNEAKEFVLQKKNNITQAKRIIEMVG